MNKNVLIGVSVVLIVVGLFIYLFINTIADPDSVESNKSITSVSTDILTNPTTKAIISLNKNGTLPVTASGTSIGKTNPFW